MRAEMWICAEDFYDGMTYEEGCIYLQKVFYEDVAGWIAEKIIEQFKKEGKL